LHEHDGEVPEAGSLQLPWPEQVTPKQYTGVSQPAPVQPPAQPHDVPIMCWLHAWRAPHVVVLHASQAELPVPLSNVAIDVMEVFAPA
jgi:hypothetical protein